jgi:hypothetical protein
VSSQTKLAASGFSRAVRAGRIERRAAPQAHRSDASLNDPARNGTAALDAPLMTDYDPGASAPPVLETTLRPFATTAWGPPGNYLG